MSLHDAAKHLAAHGRGEDKVLVHMDKGEVASLQKIAMAHGGSLTINPHTGLPEAGFLSAMLPMIAGAGLMMIPGMQAGAAGLIVGGLKTAQSGSLQKGIMAGLGAYGGAGLAGSAGAAGATATTPTSTGIGNMGSSALNPLNGPAATTIPSGGLDQLTAATTPAAPSALTSTTAAITPSSTLPQGLQDFGPKTGFETPSMPTTSGGMDVAKSAPIPQNGPDFSDAQSVGGPSAGTPTTTAATPKDFNAMNASERAQAIRSGASFSNAADWAGNNKLAALGAATSVAQGMKKDPAKPAEPDKDMGQRYSYSADKANPIPAPDVPTYEDMLTRQGNYGRQQKYFSPSYSPISASAAKDLYHFAGGGPVEQMSNQNSVGANTGFPQAYLHNNAYATPYQTPISQNVLTGDGDVSVDPYTGEQKMAEGGEADEGFLASVARAFGKGPKKQDANPGLKYAYNPDDQQYVQQQATGGLSDAHYNLGGYSDGGRLLRGPGDGVSDSIPAVIGKKQPARLADGEFVVPARIVSELGNGSTEAGARKLYAMMDRIQSARKKTVGKGKVAHNSRASKYLPA